MGKSSKRKRQGSSSDDSTDSNESEEKKREARLAEKIRRKREERRKNETPEQRAARKASKQKLDPAHRFGYTNEENPFGDSNLSNRFVWKKKLEKEGVKELPMSKRQQRESLQAKMDEIEKVRQRRKDSEQQKEEMERLRAEEARLREQQQFGDWQKKEESFHLLQTKTRSKIRIAEGRDRPVDMVARNLFILGDDSSRTSASGAVNYSSGKEIDLSTVEIELREPYLLCVGLSISELEELNHDVQAYVELESSEKTSLAYEFWSCLKTVCSDALLRARERAGLVSSPSTGIHKSILSDVNSLLEGRDVGSLRKMKDQVEAQVNTGEGDVDYWGTVLSQLDVFLARARLKQFHEDMLKKRDIHLDLMRQQANAGDTALQSKASRQEITSTDDLTPIDSSTGAIAMEKLEKDKGLDEHEDQMELSDEITLTGVTYSWKEKYKPRKPRYFNRVKTGYDWNKYNQSHYDHDNPPPKTVQGYKFNIFYPDLIDRTITPQFKMEAADHPDFAIIRFVAGPPYEDIAFKIVNREWEYARKKGFRCVFERGVLSLSFNFKRHRYRK